MGLMLERLGIVSAARPRRTLILVLAFVVLAGLVGGPVAGKLQSDGGFAPGSSESSRADAQLQRATGEDATPNLVLLVRGPGLEQRVRAAAGELARIPGVARAVPARVAADG